MHDVYIYIYIYIYISKIPQKGEGKEFKISSRMA